MQKNNYTEIMEKNHMEIPWHDYARKDNDILINNADLIEKPEGEIILQPV